MADAEEYTQRIAETFSRNALCDFYGLNKCMLIIFLIHPLIFYARKNPTYQLITHSINYAHFIFSCCHFSFDKMLLILA